MRFLEGATESKDLYKLSELEDIAQFPETIVFRDSLSDMEIIPYIWCFLNICWRFRLRIRDWV
jgi:hypothetical protein